MIDMARIPWKARHSGGHVDSFGNLNPTTQSYRVANRVALPAEPRNFVLSMTMRWVFGLITYWVRHVLCGTVAAEVELDVK
jgi:hypothetical protein